MHYSEKFEKDFMDRTLQILDSYDGSLDATLLLNCLLGLVILPKERSIERIPEEPASMLKDWGISPDSITFGSKNGRRQPQTVRQCVWDLRNAVAHFEVQPMHSNNECVGFIFKDEMRGFCARLHLEEIRDFVRKVATHLRQMDDRRCA